VKLPSDCSASVPFEVVVTSSAVNGVTLRVRVVAEHAGRLDVSVVFCVTE